MSIFSGGHILVLYLYQLPLFQQLIPPEDIYARYCGINRMSLTVNILIMNMVEKWTFFWNHIFVLVDLFFLPYFLMSLFLRLFGMTAFIHTNSSEPYSLGLHPDMTWPMIINPLLLLVLYYTLVALLQKWALTATEVLNFKKQEELTI